MTHNEYLLQRKSLEWQLEDIEIAKQTMAHSLALQNLYESAIRAIVAELVELDARFIAH